ncbi:unnamed protein product [Ostreobium quekettii]|uniref:Protein kinase domain-containing protein n=1 Tax=Ostreobium quekettii TaxID=121088 RepID=A0A8S1IUN8_9CHLO|nr:unnamed protein product [Ostreobium quekettii]
MCVCVCVCFFVDLRGNESTQAKRQQWQDVEAGRHSYLAALLSDEGEFVCGATYLRPGFLVSTHHCIMQIGPNPKVALGFTGIDEKGNVMATQICHAEYNIEHPEHPAKGNTDPTLGVDTVLLKLPSWVGLVKEEPPMTAHPTHDIYIAQSLIGFRLAPPHPHTRRRAIQAARFQIANTLMQQGSAEFLWVHTECVPGPDTSLSDPVHRGFPQFDLIAVEVIFSTYYFGVDATGAVRVMKMVEWINEERLPLAAVLCMLLLVVITGMATMWSIISCRLMHAAQHQHQSHGNVPDKPQYILVDGIYQQPKYNHKMMEFLEKQLAEGKRLKPPQGAPEDSVRQWTHALEMGSRLIRKHKEPFDLRTYYKSTDVKEIVDEICKMLRETNWNWNRNDSANVETVDIAEKVPDECLEADSENLSHLLAYTLDVDQKGTDTDVPHEWKNVKREHLEQMKELDLVDEDEISEKKERGRGSGSIVYESKWRNLPVAVKACRHLELIGWDIEKLAEFMKDVLRHLSLKSLYVGELHAITKKSRWLVMELADKDLKTFCQDNKVLSWSMKRNLIQQAAECMRYMHSQAPPLVHSDVKTSNFLVFGAKPKVKIADFGLTREVTGTMNMSVRNRRGTLVYMAPEIFEDKAPTLASDVYSLGMVMYEVVTGRQLYGIREADQLQRTPYITKQKLDGKEPCKVHLTDCPMEMVELMQACCQLDLAKRPKMDVVCMWLDQLPDVVPRKIIKDLHSIIDLASQQWRHVRYNRGILHFLSKQMECLKALTDLPRDIPMETWIKMKRDLESGENLIRRHACPFDLQRFYAIDEAKSAVETICVKLQDSVHLLDTSMAMGIAHVVPDANICADRSLLESRLRFVLFDEQVMWTDMEIEEEWYEVRRRHKESLAKVTMIADEEIDLDSGAQEIGMGGEGCVWRVQWGGKMVAAKHVSQKGRSPKIERLARAFTEAALSASLLHDHITRLLAMTKSGCTMVMELAEGNLVTWYRHNIKASCWSRIKLMHQAARGLAHVHRQPEELVHCDVKSANFLVFEDGLDGDPVVKLCDFGIATTQQPDLTTTLRQQPRTTLYCAPEIYVQKHHTQKSDVFSFGVVMCELAAQRSPYMEAEGLNHAVMRMKNDEELPCPIPDDCHKGLKPLIEQCLKCDSGERPSMDDVMEKLEKILQDCVPELQTPASSAARDVGV